MTVLSIADISVVIPAYNAASTLERALRSVANQSLSPPEILVVDDGSSDATADVVRNFSGPQVKLIQLPQNLGSSAALNVGIAAANLPWIAFLDADDEWLPNKLARQIETINGEPSVVLCGTGCQFVSPTGTSLMEIATTPLNGSVLDRWYSLLEDCVIAKQSALVRREVLLGLGGFDPHLPVGEDQDMWLRVARIYAAQVVPEILTLIHDTPHSLTKRYADRPGLLLEQVIHPQLARAPEGMSETTRARILGRRYQEAATGAMRAKSWLLARQYVRQSLAQDYDVRQNLLYLAYATPGLRHIKRLLTGR